MNFQGPFKIIFGQKLIKIEYSQISIFLRFKMIWSSTYKKMCRTNLWVHILYISPETPKKALPINNNMVKLHFQNISKIKKFFSQNNCEILYLSRLKMFTLTAFHISSIEIFFKKFSQHSKKYCIIYITKKEIYQ